MFVARKMIILISMCLLDLSASFISQLSKLSGVAIALSATKKSHIEIIYEDHEIIAISKPSGIVTMPCESANTGTAAHHVASYLENKDRNISNDVLSHGIVHRIDKEVSGLLILAKSKMTSKILSKTIKEKGVKKVYIAVVYGNFKID